MLEKLRAKPSHVKQWISLAFTVFIFSGIVFVWWSSRDARSREIEVREKTVSPVGGVVSMFSGVVADFKEKISGIPTFQETKDDAITTFASSTNNENFDIAGLVIIDTNGTSTLTATALDSSL